MQKTRNSLCVTLRAPIHSALAAAIKAYDNGGHLTFLAQKDGRPLNAQGVSRLFERAAAKGWPAGSQWHGLHKGLGRRLAELGAEVPEIMKALGHTDPRTSQIYWQAVRDAKMGERSMARLLDDLDDACMQDDAA